MLLARGISVGARGESRALAVLACRRQARDDTDWRGGQKWGNCRHAKKAGGVTLRSSGQEAAPRGGMATLGSGRVVDPVAESRSLAVIEARGLGCCGGGERCPPRKAAATRAQSRKGWGVATGEVNAAREPESRQGCRRYTGQLAVPPHSMTPRGLAQLRRCGRSTGLKTGHYTSGNDPEAGRYRGRMVLLHNGRRRVR